jgi:hypothetical protein
VNEDIIISNAVTLASSLGCSYSEADIRKVQSIIINTGIVIPDKMPADYHGKSTIEAYIIAKIKRDEDLKQPEKKLIKSVLCAIKAYEKQNITTTTTTTTTTVASDSETTALPPLPLAEAPVDNDTIVALNATIVALNAKIHELQNIIAAKDAIIVAKDAIIASYTNTTTTTTTIDTQNPWSQHFSQKFQKPYWYNSCTKLSSWVKPHDA